MKRERTKYQQRKREGRVLPILGMVVVPLVCTFISVLLSRSDKDEPARTGAANPLLIPVAVQPQPRAAVPVAQTNRDDSALRALQARTTQQLLELEQARARNRQLDLALTQLRLELDLAQRQRERAQERLALLEAAERRRNQADNERQNLIALSQSGNVSIAWIPQLLDPRFTQQRERVVLVLNRGIDEVRRGNLAAATKRALEAACKDFQDHVNQACRTGALSLSDTIYATRQIDQLAELSKLIWQPTIHVLARR